MVRLDAIILELAIVRLDATVLALAIFRFAAAAETTSVILGGLDRPPLLVTDSVTVPAAEGV